MFRVILCTVLLALASSQLRAQTAPCLTDSLYLAWYESTYASSVLPCTYGNCDQPSIRNSWIPDANDTMITVRVLFHILAEDDGSAPIVTPPQLQTAVASANARLSSSKIRIIYGYRVLHSTQYKYLVPSEHTAMKNVHSLFPASRLNIFLVSTDRSWGVYPWTGVQLTSQGGAIVREIFVSDPDDLVHEIGHCLGLWHTFQGSDQGDPSPCNACWEPADYSANPDTTGDLCSDTRPGKAEHICFDPGILDTCTGLPWTNVSWNNHMNYSYFTCNTDFTPQQAGRMRCWTNSALLPLTRPRSFVLGSTAQLATLQSAIQLCASGDTILVPPGTYIGSTNRTLDFLGKDLIIKSQSGPDNTTIDCEYLSSAFQFDQGETSAAQVVGLRIRRQSGASLVASSPVFDNCIFDTCAGSSGGVFYVRNDTATITPLFIRCVFRGNSSLAGGVFYIGANSHATVAGCEFIGNSAASSQNGGAIMIGPEPGIDVQIDNCLFSANSAFGRGGALYIQGKATLFCNTFVGNTGSQGIIYMTGTNAVVSLDRLNMTDNTGAAIGSFSGADPDLFCSNFFSNSGGNIMPGSNILPTIPGGTLLAQDPRYCNFAAGDYSLKSNSPLLPPNTPVACTQTAIGAFGVGCPTDPVLLTPVDYEVQSDNTPALDWADETFGMTKTYRLMVDDDSLFASPLVNTAGLTTSGLSITSLMPVKTWYWRANCKSQLSADPADTLVSDWSVLCRFSTRCGDVNNNGSGPTVADQTYLINYLFNSGPPPPLFNSANVNGVGSVTIADLNYLTAYIYSGGPAPVCP